MKKFTLKSSMKDVMNDPRAVDIINRSLPMVTSHPRFAEVLDYTMEDVIDDDMGSIIGISKTNIKKIIKTITDLEEN